MDVLTLDSYMYREGTCTVDDTSRLLFHALMACILAIWAWETYLELRQRQKLKLQSIPKDVIQTLRAVTSNPNITSPEPIEEVLKKKKESDAEEGNDSEEPKDQNVQQEADPQAAQDEIDIAVEEAIRDFKRTQQYGLEKNTFSIISSAIQTCLEIASFVFGLMPWMWVNATTFAETYLGMASDSWVVPLLFLAQQMVISSVIGIPFGLYKDFVIEARYGFNKKTLAIFFTDIVKGLVLNALLGGPIILLVIQLVAWGGEYFYLIVWAAMVVIMYLMLIIYPIFIMPCFNKFEPLEEGSVKRRVNELADSLKFPLTKLYVMDGSRRSAHSNAFMYGIWNNKRIVLFDTLLQQMNTDEIVAVLAHELGHWKKKHTWFNSAVTLTMSFIVLYVFSLVIHEDALYRSFGFCSHPILIGLLFCMDVFMKPFEPFVGFLMSLLSRAFEYQADRFAKDLGHAQPLKTGLVKLHTKNLSSLVVDKLYSAYHHSHPTLMERIHALEEKSKSD